jgi:uncharacterized membrane protein
MSKRTTLILIGLITLLSLAMSAGAYSRLPEMVPSHWNLRGEVNGMSPRLSAALLMPGLTLGIGLLMLFLPIVDPLGKNVDLFRPVYHGFIVSFCAFFLYLHTITLLAGIGIPIEMNRMILPALGVFFIMAGFLIENAHPNWFIGIRTPWTMSNPEVWKKTHKLGGLLFKISGAISLLGVFFPALAQLFLIVPLFTTAAITTVYSYVVYHQLTKEN